MALFPKMNSKEDALARVTDPAFLATLKDYYSYRQGDKPKTSVTYKDYLNMNDGDIIHHFYDNRQTWNNNTAFLLGDAVELMGEEDNYRKQQFAHIQDVYTHLPMPWNDPNTTFSQWGINLLGAALFDPINYLTFGVSGQIAKQKIKKATQEALKNKLRKDINKELLEEAVKKSTNELLGVKQTAKFAIGGFTAGASFSGAFDGLMQLRDIASGAQGGFDFKQSALAVTTGGIVIAPFSALFGRMGVKTQANDLLGKSVKELTNWDFHARSAVTGEAVFKALDEKVFNETSVPTTLFTKVKNYFEEDEGLVLYDDTNTPQVFKLDKVLPINNEGKVVGTGNKIPGVTNIIKLQGISDSAVTFPKTLGTPKPTYKGGQIKFNNDLEKAIYIVGSKTKKASRYDEFLDFALQHSGKTEEEIMTISRQMRRNLEIAFNNEGHLPLVTTKEEVAKAWYNSANERYNKIRNKVIDDIHGVGPNQKPPKSIINITKEIMPDRQQAAFLSRYSQSVLDDITEKGPALKEIAASITKDNLEETLVFARTLIEEPTKLAKANIGATALRQQLWTQYKDIILKQVDNLPEAEALQLRQAQIEAIEEYIKLTRIERAIKKEISLGLNASKLTAQDYGLDTLQQRALVKKVEDIVKDENLDVKKFFDNLKGSKAQQEKFNEILLDMDDPDALLKILENTDETFTRWDKVNSYLTNNILTNTATQAITVVGNATNLVRRPLEKYLKVLPLMKMDKIAAKEAWREANSQFVHFALNTGFALKRAYKSFKHYRPILDQKIMKYGDVQLQNQYNDWLKSFEIRQLKAAERHTEGIFLGKGRVVVNKAAATIAKGARYTHTLGTRLMGGIDEFFKNTSYRAHAMMAIQTIIEREHPELVNMVTARASRKLYKDAKYKELADKYLERFYNPDGSARPWEDVLNDDLVGPLFTKRQMGQSMQPLENARILTNQDRGIVTEVKQQGSRLVNEEVKKTWTQHVVDFSQNRKWSKPLGLLYINTPGSLIRAEVQRFPILGAFQDHMKRMLARDGKGNFLYPEEAAEAIARQTFGLMAWGTAVWVALYRPDVIDGIGLELKRGAAAKEREKATGERPYSIFGVELNKLDILTPFFAAKDVVDYYNHSKTYHSDLSPELEQSMFEFSTGMAFSVVKNIGSKAFYRNFIDFAYTLLNGDFTDAKVQGRFNYAVSSITKGFVPFSGILQQIDAGTESIEREMYNFWDSFASMNPLDANSDIMPVRSWTGKIVERKESMLFGVKAPDKMFPFSYRKRNEIVSKFFEERKFDYRPPSHITKAGLNLKELRYEGDTYETLPPDENGKTVRVKITNQTLYDRWMQLKSQKKRRVEVKPGVTRNLDLQEYLEYLIVNKDSKLYSFTIPGPELYPTSGGGVAMEDRQQQFLIGIIRDYEDFAFGKLQKEKREIMGQDGKTFIKLETDIIRKVGENVKAQERLYKRQGD